MDTERTNWVEGAPEIRKGLVDRAVRAHLEEHPEYLLPLWPDLEGYETYASLDALDISPHDLAKLPLGISIERVPGTNEHRLFRNDPGHHDARLWAEDGVDIPDRARGSDVVAIQYVLDTVKPGRDKNTFLYTPKVVSGAVAGNRVITAEDVKTIFKVARSATADVSYSLHRYGGAMLSEATWRRAERRPDTTDPDAVYAELLDVVEQQPESVRKLVTSVPMRHAMNRVFNEPDLLEPLVKQFQTTGDAVLDFTGFLKRDLAEDPDFKLWVLGEPPNERSGEPVITFSPLLDAPVMYEPYGRLSHRNFYYATQRAVGNELARKALQGTPEWVDAIEKANSLPGDKLFMKRNGDELDPTRLALSLFLLGRQNVVGLMILADNREVMLEGVYDLFSRGRLSIRREGVPLEADRIYRAGLIKKSRLAEATGALWLSMTRVGKFPNTPFSEHHYEDSSSAGEDDVANLERYHVDPAAIVERCEFIYERAKAVYKRNFLSFPNLGSSVETFEQYLTRQITTKSASGRGTFEWLPFDIDVPGIDEEIIRDVLSHNGSVIAELVERRATAMKIEDNLAPDSRDRIVTAFEVEFGSELRREAEKLLEGLDNNGLVIALEGLDQAAFLHELFSAAAEDQTVPRRRLLDLSVSLAADCYDLDPAQIDKAITDDERAYFIKSGPRISAARLTEVFGLAVGWRVASVPRSVETAADSLLSLDRLRAADNLIHQTADSQKAYILAVMLYGQKTIDSFLAPRIRQLYLTKGGNYKELLSWIPFAKKLEHENVVSLVQSIDSDVDQVDLAIQLEKYRREQDLLTHRGEIRSLRELKVRVAAQGRDFLALRDTNTWEILSRAPGMDFAALEAMAQHPEFLELSKGSYDKEQPFTPFEILVAPAQDAEESVRVALGSRSQGIRGNVADPAKLYHDLKHLMRARGVEGTPATLCEKVPPQLRDDVIALVASHDYVEDASTGPVYVATLHDKSDPLGWVCGNYTDCCMPFGRSLNTDYMFNPDTQYFTIRRHGRVIAQSVVVAAEEAATGKPVVVLDSIEIANNYDYLRDDIIETYRHVWGDTYQGAPVFVGTFRPTHPILQIPYDRSVGDRYRSRSGTIGYTDAWGYFLFPFTPR